MIRPVMHSDFVLLIALSHTLFCSDWRKELQGRAAGFKCLVCINSSLFLRNCLSLLIRQVCS